MKKVHISYIFLLFIIAVSIIYGISFERYNIFPNKQIKSIYHAASNLSGKYYGPWSIGIYEGTSIFDLHPAKSVTNPILTGSDVTDIDATFVADPFQLSKDGIHYIFFEVLRRDNNQGDISYAQSTDGINWEYKKVIIDEDFHLSYPYVFEWKNKIYLIPESNEDYSVRLYEATDFPNEWQYIGNLLSGHPYVDPTIFRHDNRWWLYASNPENNILNLYHSESLTSGWKPHPLNPIIKQDKSSARPGGRLIQDNGKLYRIAQDTTPYYGHQIFAYEIIELSPSTYKEKLASIEPIVTKSNTQWNNIGMHHVDATFNGEKWIAIVDGLQELK